MPLLSGRPGVAALVIGAAAQPQLHSTALQHDGRGGALRFDPLVTERPTKPFRVPHRKRHSVELREGGQPVTLVERDPQTVDRNAVKLREWGEVERL